MCVLGGGLVGRYVACKLLERGHNVRLIDSEKISDLPIAMEVIQERINPESISKNVAEFDVVVNCLPGRIGHAVRKPLLSINGISVADLAFTAEDPREYNELAIENNARLIYDVGIAPGLSNALLMFAQRNMETLNSAKIWVGGNPQEPDDEWSYMAPFSPSDVIEEYTRPARFRRGGEIITGEPLTERHFVDVPKYGQMEAFLTDGVRSMLDTIDSSELVEYTVRWPGHIQRYIDGSDSEEELLKAWKFDVFRPEFTWLAVLASDEKTSMRWDVLDEGVSSASSMARTTGLVTVEVAEMLSEGAISQLGVMPPEHLGEDQKILERIMNSMRSEGVEISESIN